MGRIPQPPEHDELLIQVQVSRQRLAEFSHDLDALNVDDRDVFVSQVGDLLVRCDGLTGAVSSWSEGDLGLPTAVDDIGAAVDALEADFDAVIAAINGEGYEAALDRQVRIWLLRIDRFRLHAMLGTMDAVDGLEELVRRIGQARSSALVELRNAAGDSTDVASDARRNLDSTLPGVRRDLELVLCEVRGAILNAADALTTNPLPNDRSTQPMRPRKDDI